MPFELSQEIEGSKGYRGRTATRTATAVKAAAMGRKNAEPWPLGVVARRILSCETDIVVRWLTRLGRTGTDWGEQGQRKEKEKESLKMVCWCSKPYIYLRFD